MTTIYQVPCFYTTRLTGFALLVFAILFFALPQAASAQPSLYSDIRAFRVGDAITIQLAERTSATRNSGWGQSRSSNLGASSSVDGGPDLSGNFGVNAKFNNESQNENRSVQRDLLQGTMTALVVGVDSLAGNLIVAGERSLNVNGETHIMKVEGSVRPFDINTNNTILSYQLANANIIYRRDGGSIRKKLFGPGALAGAATLLVIGAAIITGSN